MHLLFIVDQEREILWNSDGRRNLERSAGLRQVADCAVDCTATLKRNFAGFEQSPAGCLSMLVQRIHLNEARG